MTMEKLLRAAIRELRNVYNWNSSEGCRKVIIKYEAWKKERVKKKRKKLSTGKKS